MNCCETNSKLRKGRMALGVIAVACLVFVMLWLIETSGSTTAMEHLPADGEPESAQVAGNKPSISIAEIQARFPKEKQEELMRRAIANAREAGGEHQPSGAFGAVIVTKDGVVIADGMNHVAAENDPTWHAELHAIRQACGLLKSPKLEGCVLYASAEPCPMCLAAAYLAGLDGIVYGATTEDVKKYCGFDGAFIYEQFEKPVAARAIPELNTMRSEAVEVWESSHARGNKVDE